ncbi:aminodeoxychorismate synthase component I [Aureimonas frigidaquae]|uniref:aminodeoxychorismate synthase component I n=1 Tax=Aureimonas frigidaquae TaxID=424757 RepID=UPI000782C3A1|nr:aminodeoxychorismate synthase component I [Aureimonas frigidaquae]
MWTRRLPAISPFEAARRMRPLGGLAFLDSAQPDSPLSQRSFAAAAPFARVDIRLADGGLDRLEAALRPYRTASTDGWMPGAAIGYVAYDLAHRLERLVAPPDLRPDTRLAHFGLYGAVVTFDHATGAVVASSAGFNAALDASAPAEHRHREAERQFDALAAALSDAPPPLPDNPPLRDFTSNLSPDAYRAAVNRVRAYIREGDIYQANIAQTFTHHLPPGYDPLAFHARLRTLNPAPFAAYLEMPGETLISSSPERFLSLVEGRVETRPIKGTARRPADPAAAPAADRAAARALAASVKDRAENVMIVDLLRNDLSRVCTPDSVEVPALCQVETYASVHHLVSVVEGRLRPGLTALDLLAATFPGGSITGAPKIRAMDIITQIEQQRRGVYCGSIGYIGFDGRMDLNIAIRTASFTPESVALSAGGGITILSDPEAERDESLAKAARLLAAFGDDA